MRIWCAIATVLSGACVASPNTVKPAAGASHTPWRPEGGHVVTLDGSMSPGKLGLWSTSHTTTSVLDASHSVVVYDGVALNPGTWTARARGTWCRPKAHGPRECVVGEGNCTIHIPPLSQHAASDTFECNVVVFTHAAPGGVPTTPAAQPTPSATDTSPATRPPALRTPLITYSMVSSDKIAVSTHSAPSFTVVEVGITAGTPIAAGGAMPSSYVAEIQKIGPRQKLDGTDATIEGPWLADWDKVANTFRKAHASLVDGKQSTNTVILVVRAGSTAEDVVVGVTLRWGDTAGAGSGEQWGGTATCLTPITVTPAATRRRRRHAEDATARVVGNVGIKVSAARARPSRSHASTWSSTLPLLHSHGSTTEQPTSHQIGAVEAHRTHETHRSRGGECMESHDFFLFPLLLLLVGVAVAACVGTPAFMEW